MERKRIKKKKKKEGKNKLGSVFRVSLSCFSIGRENRARRKSGNFSLSFSLSEKEMDNCYPYVNVCCLAFETKVGPDRMVTTVGT
jgi:hypothetical protein